jgi:hypothetical protein
MQYHMFTNMVIQLELDGSGLMLSRIQGGGDWVGIHFAWLVSVQNHTMICRN